MVFNLFLHCSYPDLSSDGQLFLMFMMPNSPNVPNDGVRYLEQEQRGIIPAQGKVRLPLPLHVNLNLLTYYLGARSNGN